MADFGRAKRVTDPLADKVRARIVGNGANEPVYVSSGSEHGGYNDDQSPCLSDLVYGFLVDDADRAECPGYESDSERDASMSNPNDAVEDFVNPALLIKADFFRNVLLSHVLKALTVFSCGKSNKALLRRHVMAFLRELGYNAAICKTKWEGSGGLTAGNYEFIDVVRSDSMSNLQRYFIDLDFSDEFEVARPTHHYERLVQSLPRVFVGRGEELKQIVRIMSDAAKRSLKGRGLSLPPWRKNRYMQNKWFGPYRRTTNVIPASNPSLRQPRAEPSFAVKCRSVGFDAVNCCRRFFPATTRTR
ncbi:hypothetical protein NMG60_11034458 [Bertholletia excelsa]